MTYRATVSSALGLYVAVGGLAGLLTVAAVFSRPQMLSLLVPAGALLAVLALVRIRCRVQVLDDELRARSLLRESSVKWHDILHVGAPADRSYWSSRFYGPLVLEFIAQGSKVRVNFKLFPIECFKDVMRRVPTSAKP